MTEQMQSCDGRDEVALLVHGELVGAERRELIAHIDTCAPCRARFTELVTVEAEYADIRAPRLAGVEKERLLAGATGWPSTRGEVSARDAPSATGSPSHRPNRSSVLSWRALAAAAVVALAYLTGWITSPSATVDPAMAERLAGIEAELAELRRSRLRVAVGHPSAVVRMQEIHAVDAADGEPVIDLLLDVLERDPNPNVRLAALDALRWSELSEAEARTVLSRLLSEPSPVLRSALIDFVATRGIAGRRPLLERLERSDEDPAVRRKARTVLESLT